MALAVRLAHLRRQVAYEEAEAAVEEEYVLERGGARRCHGNEAASEAANRFANLIVGKDVTARCKLYLGRQLIQVLANQGLGHDVYESLS